jgi:hypothetical protein
MGWVYDSMSVFSDPYFKKDEAGRTVFYPWAKYGKGRIVPDDATEAEIRRAFSRMWVTVILGAAVLGRLLHHLPIFVTLPLFAIAGYYLPIQSVVKGLPFSDTEFTDVAGFLLGSKGALSEAEIEKRSSRYKIAITGMVLFVFASYILFDAEPVLEFSYVKVFLFGVFVVSVAILLEWFSVLFQLRPEWGKQARSNAFLTTLRSPRRYTLGIFSALLLAVFLTLAASSTLGSAMNKLNKTETRIDARVNSAEYSNDGRIRVSVSHGYGFVKRFSVERKTGDWLMKPPGPFGREVVLTARKSWAGTIVDNIEPRPEAQPQRASANDMNRVK